MTCVDSGARVGTGAMGGPAQHALSRLRLLAAAASAQRPGHMPVIQPETRECPHVNSPRWSGRRCEQPTQGAAAEGRRRRRHQILRREAHPRVLAAWWCSCSPFARQHCCHGRARVSSSAVAAVAATLVARIALHAGQHTVTRAAQSGRFGWHKLGRHAAACRVRECPMCPMSRPSHLSSPQHMPLLPPCAASLALLAQLTALEPCPDQVRTHAVLLQALRVPLLPGGTTLPWPLSPLDAGARHLSCEHNESFPSREPARIRGWRDHSLRRRRRRRRCAALVP